MKIIPAGNQDWTLIQALALKIWPETYREVISSDQIDYMLHRGYTPEALTQQAAEGHQFYLVFEEETPVGFYAWQSLSPTQAKLQKLYLLPSCQGKGIGQQLLERVKDQAKSAGHTQLILNVNRKNPAVSFYEKMGGKRLETLDIPYGPYVLEDYIYGWELA